MSDHPSTRTDPAPPVPAPPGNRAGGCFITFEGTEGGGKSTQIALLAERLRALGREPLQLREPGGTPIGEEIRFTLKHSEQNHAMAPETELLLMNASRAQLVREVIRPALAAGRIVLCDRFHDSTTAYQGYGRQLDLARVKALIDFAVGETRPHLTLLLHLPLETSEARRRSRLSQAGGGGDGTAATQTPGPAGAAPLRDRIEEADRGFFERVERGFLAIAASEPARVRVVDATQPVEAVAAAVWRWVEPLLRLS